MWRIVLAAALWAVSGAAWASTETDPAFGRWVVEDGKAVIEIAPCGDRACGHLVWLQSPTDTQGEAKRDFENPNPDKRMRHLCRLRLVEGLTRKGPGRWEDGTIYSTRDGDTYGFKIEGVEGDTLKVRGFLGISLLGKTQTWIRDDGMRGSCTTIDRPGSGQTR